MGIALRIMDGLQERAGGALHAGAFPVRPRGKTPGCVAADQLLSRAGDFHRYLDRPQGGEIVSV